jgi:hypothetical protein
MSHRKDHRVVYPDDRELPADLDRSEFRGDRITETSHELVAIAANNRLGLLNLRMDKKTILVAL